MCAEWVKRVQHSDRLPLIVVFNVKKHINTLDTNIIQMNT